MEKLKRWLVGTAIRILEFDLRTALLVKLYAIHYKDQLNTTSRWTRAVRDRYDRSDKLRRA